MKLFDGHCDTILGLLGNPKSGPLPPGSLYENGLQVDLKWGLEMEAYAQTFALPFLMPLMVPLDVTVTIFLLLDFHL